MTEVAISGLDSRNPRAESRLSFVADRWRTSGRLPDADDVRAVNDRILDSWYDFYRLHSPDGWDEWNDPDAPLDGRPTEEEWDSAREWFYGVVREIDAYSVDGRDMSPAFARGLVRDSVKDGIPGYRDWEAVVEPAYDARLRAAGRVAPASRDAWLREHPVSEFVEASSASHVVEPDVGLGLSGMRLTERIPLGIAPEAERLALQRETESAGFGRGRVADAALELESARESAAVAAAEREAAALAEMNLSADADEYGR